MGVGKLHNSSLKARARSARAFFCAGTVASAWRRTRCVASGVVRFGPRAFKRVCGALQGEGGLWPFCNSAKVFDP